jgi:predicted Zn-dependent protease
MIDVNVSTPGSWNVWLRVALLLLVTSSTAAQVGVVSKEKELALGAALASEFRKHSTVVSDPRPEALVRKLAGDFSPYPWRVEVVAENLGGSTHEPTYFPGGYLFVPEALLTAARDEAELAAMLAHGMAHVIERHALRHSTGIPAFIGAGGPLPLGMSREQREWEGAADRRAVALLTAAGYDPAALKAYIGREQVDPQNGLFSRWPVREVRVAAIDAAIRGK